MLLRSVKKLPCLSASLRCQPGCETRGLVEAKVHCCAAPCFPSPAPDCTPAMLPWTVIPIAVLIVLVVVAVGMLLWIFPTLLTLLNEGGLTKEELPASTRTLLFVQTGLTEYWPVIFMNLHLNLILLIMGLKI